MIRNFVTGIVVGGIVAAGGLAVVSQIAPQPAGTVVTLNPETAALPVVEQNAATVAPAAAAVTGEASAPAATNQTAAAVDPAPLPKPEPVPEPKPLPSAGTEAPALQPLPAPAALPKVTTQVETAPAVTPPATLADNSAADDALAASDLPAAPPEQSETLLTPSPGPKSATDSGLAAADVTLDNPTAPESPEDQPKDAISADQPAAEPAALPQVLDMSKSAALSPSEGLAKTVDGVTVGRLPSIAAPAPAAGDEQAAGLDAAAPQDDRPLVKYAAAFTNSEAKPLFSVLLVDTGAADLDRAALAALPFAVSFVIDPLDPAAAAVEKIYRDGGKEVVMLGSGIPDGATASDLEQTFQANAAVLAQSVAVMDLGQGGFSANRALAAMVVPLIKDQGRGLVTFAKGLNAADQVARREGVAGAVIFSELDAGNEAAPAIRRYLDRAVFKANQDGRVVVLGTTRPETIAALMEWSVEGKGATVALAPISAVLSAK